MYLCVGMCGCVYMVCVHQRTTQVSPSKMSFISFSGTWGSLFRLDWLSSKSQASSCLHLPTLEPQAHHYSRYPDIQMELQS